jgi:hypothetical protein
MTKRLLESVLRLPQRIAEPATLCGPHLESRILEMTVESKGAPYVLSLHERERDAIGEADFLIRILFEKPESFVLIVCSGAEYLKGLGSIEGARALRGEGVRASAGE